MYLFSIMSLACQSKISAKFLVSEKALSTKLYNITLSTTSLLIPMLIHPMVRVLFHRSTSVSLRDIISDTVELSAIGQCHRLCLDKIKEELAAQQGTFVSHPNHCTRIPTSSSCDFSHKKVSAKAIEREMSCVSYIA